MIAILGFVLSIASAQEPQERPTRERPDVISIPPMGIMLSRGVEYDECIPGQYRTGRSGRGLTTEMAEICAGHLERQAELDITELDAVIRYHDADTRRQVALRGIDSGVDTYADGDMVATGHAATATAMYSNSGMPVAGSFGAGDAYARVLAYRSGGAYGGANAVPVLGYREEKPASPAAPPPPVGQPTSDSESLRADLAASKARVGELRKKLDELKGVSPASAPDSDKPQPTP